MEEFWFDSQQRVYSFFFPEANRPAVRCTCLSVFGCKEFSCEGELLPRLVAWLRRRGAVVPLSVFFHGLLFRHKETLCFYVKILYTLTSGLC